MSEQPFTAEHFTATKWRTSGDKAIAMNELAAFVLSGFNQELWTGTLYNTLSQYLFGHIAHYDACGFWYIWFDSHNHIRSWLDMVAQHQPVGDPSYTWSDAERVFQSWLQRHKNEVTARIDDLIKTKTEQTELDRLLQKYPAH